MGYNLFEMEGWDLFFLFLNVFGRCPLLGQLFLIYDVQYTVCVPLSAAVAAAAAGCCMLLLLRAALASPLPGLPLAALLLQLLLLLPAADVGQDNSL